MSFFEALGDIGTWLRLLHILQFPVRNREIQGFKGRGRTQQPEEKLGCRVRLGTGAAQPPLVYPGLLLEFSYIQITIRFLSIFIYFPSSRHYPWRKQEINNNAVKLLMNILVKTENKKTCSVTPAFTR